MKWPERLPRRLPLTLFGVLALASIGAFYLTQHLKIENPLINGDPRADPAVINPRDGGVCLDESKKPVSYRRTEVGFYLQSKSDTVDVDVFNAENTMVAEMAGSGRYIKAGPTYSFFSWDGRESDGQYAPAGVYSFHVVLLGEGRDSPIPGVSVRVEFNRPKPRVTLVTVNQLTGPTTAGSATTGTATTGTATTGTATTGTATTGTATTGTATTTGSGTDPTATFTPGPQSVTIHYKATTNDIGADVLVYRSQPNGTLTLVKTFGTSPGSDTAVWDGRIKGRPAPAGTYLIGLSVLDSACTKGQFPLVTDPAPGSTDGAGVNVTYLSATPPLVPVSAGQFAAVAVQSGGAAYRWQLRLAGQSKVIGHGISSSAELHVRLPDLGLYDLTLSGGPGEHTAVPLVASGVGARAAAKVLVVLPALSWQGDNATDGSSDGLIDSLADSGDEVNLQRPLVAGLPQDFSDEVGLLDYLNAQHDSYDLTTDVALAEGTGPTLLHRSGVILDGTFTWLPSEIVNPLHGYVAAGGAVFAAGLRSLQQQAAITTTRAGLLAGPAQRLSRDPFGVTHGAVSSTDGELITPLVDHLGIFTNVAAFAALRYQVLDPSGGTVASAAGVSDATPTVVGFRLKRGTVVEAGLPDFGLELATDVDARELLGQVWQTVLR